MADEATPQTAAERGHVTRAVEVALDPSPSQERWLRSYVGSMRAAYNWALAEVRDNLAVRADDRARGVPDDELTSALSWSRAALTSRWRAARDDVHPWHRDVSIHAFRTGLDNAALALKNFSESKSGTRRGAKVGFPRFKNRRSRQAITFVELADGVDHRHWINPDTRAHVRSMLPQRANDDTWERRHADDQVRGWPVEGRVPAAPPRRREPDRAIARCENGSRNRAKLVRRRAKLHGRITATRKLYLHELSRRLAGGFDLVCIEDLNVAGMARRKGLRNGRSVTEASMAELARQLDHKTTARSAHLVRIGRYYPSSQTCSRCGSRTKLPLGRRVYDCTHCGLVLDRDVNAARNIRAEGERLMREQHEQDVASIRGETGNGEPRPGETEPVPGAGGHGPSEAATDPAATALVGVA